MNTSLSLYYRDWSGEPSQNPEDDCGYINYGGVYHQRDCSLVIPYICEKPAAGVSSVSSGKRRVEIRYMTVDETILSFIFLTAMSGCKRTCLLWGGKTGTPLSKMV